MLEKKELDTLIENKEFDKINNLILKEFEFIFGKLTNTENLNLSFTNLIPLMKSKYPEISERLDFLSYTFSNNETKNYEKTYNLLNLYLNFIKFYSL